MTTPTTPDTNTVTVPTTGLTYRGYSGTLSDQAVLDAYIARYHQAPEQIIRYQHIVWAGPIPGSK